MSVHFSSKTDLWYTPEDFTKNTMTYLILRQMFVLHMRMLNVLTTTLKRRMVFLRIGRAFAG